MAHRAEDFGVVWCGEDDSSDCDDTDDGGDMRENADENADDGGAGEDARPDETCGCGGAADDDGGQDDDVPERAVERRRDEYAARRRMARRHATTWRRVAVSVRRRYKRVSKLRREDVWEIRRATYCTTRRCPARLLL